MGTLNLQGTKTLTLTKIFLRIFLLFSYSYVAFSDFFALYVLIQSQKCI